MTSLEKIFAKPNVVNKPSIDALPREILITRQSNGEGYSRIRIERRYGANIRSSQQFEGAEAEDVFLKLCGFLNGGRRG